MRVKLMNCIILLSNLDLSHKLSRSRKITGLSTLCTVNNDLGGTPPKTNNSVHIVVVSSRIHKKNIIYGILFSIYFSHKTKLKTIHFNWKYKLYALLYCPVMIKENYSLLYTSYTYRHYIYTM